MFYLSLHLHISASFCVYSHLSVSIFLWDLCDSLSQCHNFCSVTVNPHSCLHKIVTCSIFSLRILTRSGNKLFLSLHIFICLSLSFVFMYFPSLCLYLLCLALCFFALVCICLIVWIFCYVFGNAARDQ